MSFPKYLLFFFIKSYLILFFHPESSFDDFINRKTVKSIAMSARPAIQMTKHPDRRTASPFQLEKPILGKHCGEGKESL